MQISTARKNCNKTRAWSSCSLYNPYDEGENVAKYPSEQHETFHNKNDNDHEAQTVVLPTTREQNSIQLKCELHKITQSTTTEVFFLLVCFPPTCGIYKLHYQSLPKVSFPIWDCISSFIGKYVDWLLTIVIEIIPSGLFKINWSFMHAESSSL